MTDARVVGPSAGQVVVLACRLRPAPIPPPDPPTPSVYRLQVYPATREFELLRIDVGKATALVPRQISTAIRRDDDWNRLELSCIGDRIAARANGVDLGAANDGTYTQGSLRVNVGGPLETIPHGEIRIDDLVVYGP